MALISSDKGGGSNFEPCPTGTHVARCVTVVDLGFQDTTWGAKEMVYVGFEVPLVRVAWTKDDVEHEGPAIIGNRYTNSIHPDSNLGKNLISWRGRAFTEDEKAGFDLFSILDVPCMISVVHNIKGEKTYANIASIMGVPKGMIATDRETDILAYTPQDAAKAGNFDKMPEWLQKLCTEGHRMKDSPNEYKSDGGFDDDIPFAFILPTAYGAMYAAQEMLQVSSNFIA